MFIYLDDKGKYVSLPYNSDKLVTRLDKGIYNVERLNEELIFFEPNKSFEKGKMAEAGIFKQAKEYVLDFFSEIGKEVRKEMGQQSRLGMFFKGNPGTGKTFLAAKLVLHMIEQEDGIGIYTNRLSKIDLVQTVDAIRAKDPNRFVAIILDEFEKEYEDLRDCTKNELLAFLDGGKSRDNVLVIATANSLNGIPSTLLQRPGRFEKVLEFSIQDADIRDTIIRALVPEKYTDKVDTQEIINYVEFTEVMKNLTIDKLKSIVRDALINFLKTGKLFPPSTEMLRSIEKEELDRTCKNKKNKGAKPLNPWQMLMKARKEAEEEEDGGF